MLSKNATFTIGSKFVILLANFALVVFSTHIWGSTGRGEIALVMANISIITIFNNVFCGSTIAYHAPRLQRELLFIVSLPGALLISVSGAIIFSSIFRFNYFLPLFMISLLMSLTTVISSFWLGKNKIQNYNLLTIMSPVAILISLVILYFIFNSSTLVTYFQAFYFGTGFVLVLAIIWLSIIEPFRFPVISLAEIKSITNYGMNNEFNYFIQFLNYRLAYYFIAKILGLSLLGVFSIAVSITEAVWIISRSMSAVHFSNVINSEDQLKNRTETMIFLRQSFRISLIFIIILIVVPETLYRLVFGNEFSEVKKYIIYLIPGILSIAVTNLYGHYFAGTGKLSILRNKSLIGLAATLLLLPFLTRKYQLTGVCITLDISYLLSSFYLWLKFRKDGKLLLTETVR